jgi:hypothetical protein
MSHIRLVKSSSWARLTSPKLLPVVGLAQDRALASAKEESSLDLVADATCAYHDDPVSNRAALPPCPRHAGLQTFACPGRWVNTNTRIGMPSL